MTPEARVQAAIEILDRWQAGELGMDKVLTAWGRTNRFAGSKDRAAIADLLYDALRRMRSAAWVAGADLPADARTVFRGLMLLDGLDPGSVFTGARHAPPSLAPHERVQRKLSDAPRFVRLNLPDWLEPLCHDLPDAALEGLCDRAPLDLRVNRLKSDPQHAAGILARDGIETTSGPLTPDVLRVTQNPRRVARSTAYLDGLVEIQDAASQAVAIMADATPGQTVLDLCAGGGGKTLALSAAMKGQGNLMASDISMARMSDLRTRAVRAGAEVRVVPPGELEALTGQCDLVLVDAPCSGMGAWRRNPDAKWRLTRASLDNLMRLQRKLIVQAATYLRPDGRLVYATCSMLPCENEAAVEDALMQLTGLSLLRSRLLTPQDGGDGFYCAVMQRQAQHQ